MSNIIVKLGATEVLQLLLPQPRPSKPVSPISALKQLQLRVSTMVEEVQLGNQPARVPPRYSTRCEIVQDRAAAPTCSLTPLPRSNGSFWTTKLSAAPREKTS